MRDAGSRSPLLLLILGSAPPVSVQGLGRLGLEEAVRLHMRSVLDRAEGHHLDEATLVDHMSDVLAWITWQEVGRAVEEQRALFRSGDPSVDRAVSRVADSVTQAIARHSLRAASP